MVLENLMLHPINLYQIWVRGVANLTLTFSENVVFLKYTQLRDFTFGVEPIL
jgi:hypothetical protein